MKVRGVLETDRVDAPVRAPRRNAREGDAKNATLRGGYFSQRILRLVGEINRVL